MRSVSRRIVSPVLSECGDVKPERTERDKGCDAIERDDSVLNNATRIIYSFLPVLFSLRPASMVWITLSSVAAPDIRS